RVSGTDPGTHRRWVGRVSGRALCAAARVGGGGLHARLGALFRRSGSHRQSGPRPPSRCGRAAPVRIPGGALGALLSFPLRAPTRGAPTDEAVTTVHIGTSGWSYDHCQGVLYPPDTPVRERLDYYVRRFQTVEVNATYYRWPPDTTFAGWRERLPEGFRMRVKAPRGLTHATRLKEPARGLGRVAGGLRQLRDRLGILLVQLPPGF